MHSFVIKRIYEELALVTGEENIYTSSFDKDAYSVDVWSISRNWVDHGLIKELPDFVVLPENTEQISKILRVANEFKIPVIPRGGGAGGPLFWGAAAHPAAHNTPMARIVPSTDKRVMRVLFMATPPDPARSGPAGG